MQSPNNLLTFRQELNLSKRAMAQILDVHEGNYGRMEKGDLNISPLTILKFQKQFPSINPEWWAYNKEPKSYEQKVRLLTGSSKYSNARSLGATETTDNEDTQFVEISQGRYRMKVKLVPEYAYAGYLSGYADPEFLEELPVHEVIVNQIHRGKYQAFEIAGDSMDDGSIKSIPDGTIVTGREIQRQHWVNKLHTHRWPNFIFVHKSEGIVCKQIAHQDLITGILTLRSINPDRETYPDFDVQMDDLLQIFNVVKRDMPF
jgi:DNA-binding XRE family transcriptional regulator